MSSRAAWSPAVLALLAVGLAAGCTSTSEGSPSPETTDTVPVSVPSTSVEETPSFPPRPQDILLDDINPCEVWTPEQRADLGIDEPAPGAPEPHPIGGGMDCAWFTPRGVEPESYYSVVTRPELDLLALWGDDTARITEEVAEIAGFPAIRQTAPEGAADSCGFHVGTAEGQVLSFDINIYPNEYSVDEHCELVVAAAELAIENLR